MNFTGFISKLELSYAPMSNHDFSLIKSEKIIKEILKKSMIYILAQRSMLTFENVIESDEGGGSICFEIHKQDCSSKLICKLPYYQEKIEINETKQVKIEFGSYDPDWKENALPINNVNGMKFYNENDDFLLWLSPDKFLHLHWCGILEATVTGNLEEFTTFKVHYVGKSTDQPVYDRLTGHYTLQDILSIERPISKGALPTHEVMLLLFNISDTLQISMIDSDSKPFLDIEGKKLPSNKTVSLDAEKALIKLLNPEYNHPTKRFPNYPKSKDGLFQYNFSRYSYQLKDSITLEYNDMRIVGNIDENIADMIVIDKNETVTIIKIGDLGCDNE